MGGYKDMKQIGDYFYEVNDANEVRIWHKDRKDAGGDPNIFQPGIPDSVPFVDKNTAEAWAIKFINEQMIGIPTTSVE